MRSLTRIAAIPVFVLMMLEGGGCIHPRTGVSQYPPEREFDTLVGDRWLVHWNFRAAGESPIWMWGNIRGSYITKTPPASIEIVPSHDHDLFQSIVRYSGPFLVGAYEVTADYSLWLGPNMQSLSADEEPERVWGGFVFGEKPDSIVRERLSFGDCRGWIEILEKRADTGALENLKINAVGILEKDLVVRATCELRSWPKVAQRGKAERVDFERQCVEGFIQSIRVERLRSGAGGG